MKIKNLNELTNDLKTTPTRNLVVCFAVDLSQTSGIAVQMKDNLYIGHLGEKELLKFFDELPLGPFYYIIFEKNQAPYTINKDTKIFHDGTTAQDFQYAWQNNFLKNFYKLWNPKQHKGFLMDLQASTWQAMVRKNGIEPKEVYQELEWTDDEVDAFLMLTFFAQLWKENFGKYIARRVKYHPNLYFDPEKRINSAYEILSKGFIFNTDTPSILWEFWKKI